MDELSPLFQEIEFHERYRGYDPDEVDAFVDRVARAAAVMRGRISELHERVEAAEARGGRGADHFDTEETLTRTLVLAQRTADAAIAEAHEEANRLTADAASSAQAILSAAEAEAQLTLSEAQADASATVKDAVDRAGLILAEVETDRRTMLAEAESLASESAAIEREHVAAEVSELHEYRAFLADDIEILERHLTEERHQLTASLSALTDLLESPEAFRVARPPATSGIDIDDGLIVATADDGDEIDAVEPAAIETESVTAEGSAVAEETAVEEIAGEEIAVEPAEATLAPTFEPAAESGIIDLVAAETVPDSADEGEVGHSDDGEVVYTEIQQAEPEPDSDSGTGAETIETEPSTGGEPAYAGMAEGAVGDAQAPPLVTAADLQPSAPAGGRFGFETSTVDGSFADGGPSTEAMPVVAEGSLFADPEMSDDPFLDQLRDVVGIEPVLEGDEQALSAFFDQEDDDSGRTWFGRRR